MRKINLFLLFFSLILVAVIKNKTIDIHDEYCYDHFKIDISYDGLTYTSDIYYTGEQTEVTVIGCQYMQAIMLVDSKDSSIAINDEAYTYTIKQGESLHYERELPSQGNNTFLMVVICFEDIQENHYYELHTKRSY